VIAATEAGAALLLGLAGAGHCLGMCGGIGAALSLGGARTAGVTLAYQSGRIASYSLLGALLGLAAGTVHAAPWALGLRYVAGLLLMLMGLYVADWWRGMARVEQLGSALWRPVQKLSSRLLPVRHRWQALALGLCWGLMPCGLIYSSLAWAAATARGAADAALLMALFGLGTLPAMLAVSLGAGQVRALLGRRGLKVTIGALLVAAGAWTLYITTAHGAHLAPAAAPDAQDRHGAHH